MTPIVLKIIQLIAQLFGITTTQFSEKKTSISKKIKYIIYHPVNQCYKYI